MVRRVSRVLGLVYLLLAALNLARHGIFSLAWIAWALLGAGALILFYTPVEKGGKTQYQVVFAGRNKLSAAVTILGAGLLVFVILFHR